MTTRYLINLLHILWHDFSLAALMVKTLGVSERREGCIPLRRGKRDSEEIASLAESKTTWAFVPP